jgi:hypothetical protein
MLLQAYLRSIITSVTIKFIYFVVNVVSRHIKLKPKHKYASHTRAFQQERNTLKIKQ